MRELVIGASRDNLDRVMSFINNELEKLNCSPKLEMKFDLAAEEIFVNIADYAYGGETGEAVIQFEYLEDGNRVRMCFIDEGSEFDPLAAEDPDVSESAEQRGIGGLGILLVKKSMDVVSYVRENGQNRFTIEKCL